MSCWSDCQRRVAWQPVAERILLLHSWRCRHCLAEAAAALSSKRLNEPQQHAEHGQRQLRVPHAAYWHSRLCQQQFHYARLRRKFMHALNSGPSLNNAAICKGHDFVPYALIISYRRSLRSCNTYRKLQCLSVVVEDVAACRTNGFGKLMVNSRPLRNSFV